MQGSPPILSFLFYGCWNRVNCEDKNQPYNYRDIVLDVIAKKEKHINDFYIAGDNWYPNMMTTHRDSTKSLEETIEYYFTNVLKSGYAKIYDLQKETYIVLGNHDEVSNYQDGAAHILKNCMLNTQLYYMKHISDEIIKTPTLELLDAYYNSQIQMPLKRNNSLSLVKAPRVKSITKPISQKSLSKTRTPEIMLYDDINSIIKPNYIMIFINTNRIHNEGYLGKLRGHIDIYNKTKRPKFVMGHVPMFYFREKPTSQYFRQMKIEDDSISDAKKNRYIQTLYDILAEHNCIYLCADTHSFEIMNISQKDSGKTLVQIVCGTGGGEPDIVETDNIKFMNYGIERVQNDNEFVEKYRIQGNCVNAYGYSVIDVIDQNTIKVIYKKIIAPIAPNPKKGIHKSYSTFTYFIVRTGTGWSYTEQTSSKPIVLDHNINLEYYKKDAICNHIDSNLVVSSSDKSLKCFEKKNKEKKHKKTDN